MKGKRISVNAQRIRYLVSDLIMGAIAFWIFNIVRYFLLDEYDQGYSYLWAFLGSTKLIIEQCLVPVGMLGIFWLSGYYNKPYGKSRLQEFNTTFFSALINTVIIYLILLINDQTGHRIINYELIIILFGLLFLLPYIGRLILTGFSISRFRKSNWKINVLIAGNTTVSRKVAKKLENSTSRVRYNIVGFVDIPGEKSLTDRNDSLQLEGVADYCKEFGVDQIILAPKNYDDKKVLTLLSYLFPLDIPIKISPDTFSFVTSAVKMRDIYAEPFIDLASPTMSECSLNIKRAFDVFASSLVLLILSPLYLTLSLIIKSTSKGPVFYSQERIGRHQKPFTIYKFRTMIVDSEPEGPRLSATNDPRITKAGHWMRKYRLDELPQFWNVLKGEMSIVGPRPEREYYINEIVKKAPYYALVCQVRPGITSWGMVKYGYASSVGQMVERTRYDLIYLANMSLSVDCKILIYTVKTIFTGKGV